MHLGCLFVAARRHVDDARSALENRGVDTLRRLRPPRLLAWERYRSDVGHFGSGGVVVEALAPRHLSQVAVEVLSAEAIGLCGRGRVLDDERLGAAHLVAQSSTQRVRPLVAVEVSMCRWASEGVELVRLIDAETRNFTAPPLRRCRQDPHEHLPPPSPCRACPAVAQSRARSRRRAARSWRRRS